MSTERKELSRADKTKHTGVDYEIRQMADRVRSAFVKLKFKSIPVNPQVEKDFEEEFSRIKQLPSKTEEEQAIKLSEMSNARDKFLALRDQLATATRMNPEDILAQSDLLAGITTSPVSTTTTTSTTPTTPVTGTTPQIAVSEHGAKRNRSTESKDEDTAQPKKSARRRLLVDDAVDEKELDEELKYLDDNVASDKTIKDSLRKILKRPERVIYYDSLCPCRERTKVDGEALCSPCKRAKFQKELSAIKRKKRIAEKAATQKEQQLIKESLLMKEIREAQENEKLMDQARALLGKLV